MAQVQSKAGLCGEKRKLGDQEKLSIPLAQGVLPAATQAARAAAAATASVASSAMA